MIPTETPLYRLEVRGTTIEWSCCWCESYATLGGPAIDWDSAMRQFRVANKLMSEEGIDDMIYRVVRA